MKQPNRLVHPLVQRTLSLAGLTLLIGMVLAACGQPLATQLPDQQEARAAALAAVDDAFAGAMEADGEDTATATVLAALSAEPGLHTAAVEPMLLIRRVAMQRDRQLLTLSYDGTQEPATATAEVAIQVTGTAQIWQVWPDRSLPRALVGQKPIAMEGIVELSLEHGENGWRLTQLDSAGFSQGANAAAVESVSFAPNPLLAGRNDNVATVTLNEPSTDDDFLVAARSRRLRPHGLLNDAGMAPDDTADDDVYNGNVWVGEDARPGTHLAFVTALDYSRTVNLSTTDGNYDDPYTDTVQPILVDIAAEQ